MDDYHQLIADRVVHQANALGRSIDYIEVGVLTGNSALAVLSTTRCRHATLIDNFSNSHCGSMISSRQIVEHNLSRFEGVFEIKEGDSRTVLPSVREEFDIGFVDGEHTEEGCRSDIEKMFPLLRKNGIMFVDDLENPGCIKDVTETFAQQHGLKMIHHHVHYGLGELKA